MPELHEQDELDPSFLHARREAWIILSIFVLFAAYTLGVSHWLSPKASIGVAERKLLGESDLTIPTVAAADEQSTQSSSEAPALSPSESPTGTEPSVGSSTVATIVGIPSWVFYGIVLPWFAAIGVTGWFCFSKMSDDPIADTSSLATSGDSQSETKSPSESQRPLSENGSASKEES